MQARRLLLALPALPLSGCLSLAGDQLADIETKRPTAAKPIQQSVGSFSFHLDGGKMITSNKAGRILNDEILGRWVERGYIQSHTYVKDVQFAPPPAPGLRLTLSGHQEGESSIVLQVFSGITLLLIPYYVDTQMQVTYELEDVETGCRYSASVSDSYNTIVSLLLLPATPFSGLGRSRTFDRLADNLYQQLAARGAFEANPSCAPARTALNLRTRSSGSESAVIARDVRLP